MATGAVIIGAIVVLATMITIVILQNKSYKEALAEEKRLKRKKKNVR